MNKYKVTLDGGPYNSNREVTITARDAVEAKKMANSQNSMTSYSNRNYNGGYMWRADTVEQIPLPSSHPYADRRNAVGAGVAVAAGAALWANHRARKAQRAQETEDRRIAWENGRAEREAQEAEDEARQAAYEASNRPIFQNAIAQDPSNPARAIIAGITDPPQSLAIKFMMELDPLLTSTDAQNQFNTARNASDYRNAINKHWGLNVDSADSILKEYPNADPDIAAAILADDASTDAIPDNVSLNSLPDNATEDETSAAIERLQAYWAAKTEELLPKVKEEFVQKQQRVHHERRVAKVTKFFRRTIITLVSVIVGAYGGWQLLKLALHSIPVWLATTTEVGLVLLLIGVILWGIYIAFQTLPVVMTFVTIMIMVGTFYFCTRHNPVAEHKQYVTTHVEMGAVHKATPEVLKAKPAQDLHQTRDASGNPLATTSQDASVATDDQLQPLLTAWVNASKSGDARTAAALFADPVDYYDKGLLNHEQLVEDLEQDLKQWPVQHYSITRVVRIEKLSRSTWNAVFEIGFNVQNPTNGKARAGTVNENWTVRQGQSGNLQIVSVRSVSNRSSVRKSNRERVYESRPVSR
jgi:hypothetical protein